MAAGWPSLNSGQSTTETFPAGDTRTWSVSVAKDLTGYTAEWRMGQTGRTALLSRQLASPPSVAVLKASGANLAIVVNGDGTSILTWTTTYADTIGLAPALYDHQAVVIDSQGEPFTVTEGRVNLTPSLRAVQAAAAPLAISPVVSASFAIWQGDDTPAQVWSFGPPNAPYDLTGSVFTLTLNGLASPTSSVTIRSDAGDGNLVVDTSVQTLAWHYTAIQSAAIPASGATYQIHRLINGTTQLWLHGSIVGLIP